ncbi:MAG: tyrosine-protein phosphatase [Bacilli bacterium]
MLERFIEMEGIHNFRDLGLLKTKCNGVVKEGLIYRSARLSKATANDIAKIKDLNIKMILDYRFYDEMLDNPNVVIEGVANNVVPAFKQRSKHSHVAIEDFLKEGDLNKFEKGLLDEYQQLPFDNNSYQFLFNELKRRPDYAILHHCTVGRDRTGVASALILKLLNVDDETIKEDYLLSNEALRQFFLEHHENLGLSDLQIQELGHAIMIKDYFLDYIYELILSKYVTFDDYFKQEYNLSDQDIINIKEHYIKY